MVKTNYQVIYENKKRFCTKKLPQEVNISRYRNLHEQKISRKKTGK